MRQTRHEQMAARIARALVSRDETAPTAPLSGADRQARYRLRREAAIQDLIDLTEAVVSALDRGRCARFADNLPEEPQLAAQELTRRLSGRYLIACASGTARQKFGEGNGH